jgi:hypothetical protein
MKHQLSIGIVAVIVAVIGAFMAFRPGSAVYSNHGMIRKLGNNCFEVNSVVHEPPFDAELAVAFTVTESDYELESVEVGIGMMHPGANHAIVRLCADARGIPGEVLEEEVLSGRMKMMDMISDDYNQVVPCSRKTAMRKGATYWVVVAEGPGASIGWVESPSKPPQPFMCRMNGDEWTWSKLTPREFSLRVNGKRLNP